MEKKIYISKKIQKYLYTISGIKINDSDYINDFNKHINKIIYFLKKDLSELNDISNDDVCSYILIDQLPDGIYNNIYSLIETLSTNYIKDDNILKGASFIHKRNKTFDICKKIPYLEGNIISQRDKEIDDILLTLCKKEKRNILLTGDAGVGKSAIIKAINARIREGNVPRELKATRIHEVSLPYIAASIKHEDPMNVLINILEEANNDDSHIIFVDEIHSLLVHKANDILKPYLTGKIRLIGATTTDEYHQIITNDLAVTRRFTVIKINEPDIDKTTKMMMMTKHKFENHYNCVINEEICNYIASLSTRYMGTRKNPDKSFDILDRACAYLDNNEYNFHVHNKKRSINSIKSLNNDIKDLEKIGYKYGDRVLNKNYISKVISNIVGVDNELINNALNYNWIKNKINDKIINQKEAIKKLSNTVNVMKYITFNQLRPISIYLLFGPVGCGKTQTLMELSNLIFGSKNIINFDLEPLKDSHKLSELRGAPPGYVGHDKPSILIKQLSENPQSIIEFSNIDKCHSDILTYIVNSVKNGKFVDSSGKEVFLNNNIIVFSISSEDKDYDNITKTTQKTMGFSKTNNKTEEQKNCDEISKSITTKLSINLPDICDTTIIYNKLSEDNLEKIFDINKDKYIQMFNDIDINEKELKKVILDKSKNGHDIINGLISEIPKLIFEKNEE